MLMPFTNCLPPSQLEAEGQGRHYTAWKQLIFVITVDRRQGQKRKLRKDGDGRPALEGSLLNVHLVIEALDPHFCDAEFSARALL